MSCSAGSTREPIVLKGLQRGSAGSGISHCQHSWRDSHTHSQAANRRLTGRGEKPRERGTQRERCSINGSVARADTVYKLQFRHCEKQLCCGYLTATVRCVPCLVCR